MIYTKLSFPSRENEGKVSARSKVSTIYKCILRVANTCMTTNIKLLFS